MNTTWQINIPTDLRSRDAQQLADALHIPCLQAESTSALESLSRAFIYYFHMPLNMGPKYTKQCRRALTSIQNNPVSTLSEIQTLIKDIENKNKQAKKRRERFSDTDGLWMSNPDDLIVIAEKLMPRFKRYIEQCEIDLAAHDSNPHPLLVTLRSFVLEHKKTIMKQNDDIAQNAHGLLTAWFNDFTMDITATQFTSLMTYHRHSPQAAILPWEAISHTPIPAKTSHYQRWRPKWLFKGWWARQSAAGNLFDAINKQRHLHALTHTLLHGQPPLEQVTKCYRWIDNEIKRLRHIQKHLSRFWQRSTYTRLGNELADLHDKSSRLQSIIQSKRKNTEHNITVTNSISAKRHIHAVLKKIYTTETHNMRSMDSEIHQLNDETLQLTWLHYVDTLRFFHFVKLTLNPQRHTDNIQRLNELMQQCHAPFPATNSYYHQLQPIIHALPTEGWTLTQHKACEHLALKPLLGAYYVRALNVPSCRQHILQQFKLGILSLDDFPAHTDALQQALKSTPPSTLIDNPPTFNALPDVENPENGPGKTALKLSSDLINKDCGVPDIAQQLTNQIKSLFNDHLSSESQLELISSIHNNARLLPSTDQYQPLIDTAFDCHAILTALITLPLNIMSHTINSRLMKKIMVAKSLALLPTQTCTMMTNIQRLNALKHDGLTNTLFHHSKNRRRDSHRDTPVTSTQEQLCQQPTPL